MSLNKENYIKVSLKISNEFFEPVLAVLTEIGFDGFEEKEETLDAYVPEAKFSREALTTAVQSILGTLSYEMKEALIAPRDWNAEWEEGFKGVEVGDFAQIIPPFKTPKTGISNTVIINPRMAFGTGHHATTQMMVAQMENLDLKGKMILDMGCGTGVLGILAAKLGAKSVVGIDIDEWARDNASENVKLNRIEQIEILKGDVSAIPKKEFGIIFANINRNILISDGAAYAAHLIQEGILLISGVLIQDEAKVLSHFKGLGFEPLHKLEKLEWLSWAFRKK